MHKLSKLCKNLLYSARLHLFYKKQQYCEILLLFKIYILMLESVIYSCDGKAEFSASLLRSFVSHDPSEVILIYTFSAQETFIINFKNCCSI